MSDDEPCSMRSSAIGEGSGQNSVCLENRSDCRLVHEFEISENADGDLIDHGDLFDDGCSDTLESIHYEDYCEEVIDPDCEMDEVSIEPESAKLNLQSKTKLRNEVIVTESENGVYYGKLNGHLRKFVLIPRFSRPYSMLGRTARKKRLSTLRKLIQVMTLEEDDDMETATDKTLNVVLDVADQCKYFGGTSNLRQPEHVATLPMDIEIAMFTIPLISNYGRRKIKKILMKSNFDFLNSTRDYERRLRENGYDEDYVVNQYTIEDENFKEVTVTAALAKNPMKLFEQYLMKTSHLIVFDGFEQKLWVRLGVDKGGNTTKVMLSIVNRPQGIANSPFNWLLLGVYNDTDNYDNLKKYCEPIFCFFNNLKSVKIPGFEGEIEVKLFVVADHKCLSSLFGLKGTSSNYPCSRCTISKEEVAIMSSSSKRRSDHDSESIRDETSGADTRRTLSYAKKPLISFDNVEQAPPALHMQQGPASALFIRMEKLITIIATARILGLQLTEEMLTLDSLELAEEIPQKELQMREKALKNYEEWLEKGAPEITQSKKDVCMPHCALRNIKKSPLAFIKCSLCGCADHRICCGLLDDPDIPSRVCLYCNNSNEDKLQLQHECLRAALAMCKKRVERKDLVKGKERFHVLREFRALCAKQHVSLGVYFGGILNGNDARNFLRKSSVFTKFITDLAVNENETEILQNVASLYLEILQPLSTMSSLTKASFLDADERNNYEQCAAELKEKYKTNFPRLSATVKLHSLLVESVSFMKTYNTIGLCSEQGLEASHPIFEKSFAKYSHLRSTESIYKGAIKHMNNRNCVLLQIKDGNVTGYIEKMYCDDE